MIDSKLKLSIVVPTLGSNWTLDEIVSRIIEILEPRILQFKFEIVFVVDYSGSENQLNGQPSLLTTHHSIPITLVLLSKRVGQISATRYGMEFAKGDWVLTLDDDLCIERLSLVELMEYAELNELDFVSCVKLDKELRRSLFRRVGSKIVRKLGCLAYKTDKNHIFSSITIHHSSYIVPLARSDQFRTIPGWFYNASSKYSNYNCKFVEFSRPSNYSFWTLIRLFLQLTSSLQMKLFSYFSLVVRLGILFLLTVLIFGLLFLKNTPTGFLSLLFLLLINTTILLMLLSQIVDLRILEINRREARIHIHVKNATG